MKRSLSEGFVREVGTQLQQAHQKFARRYPGPSRHRQPVHTVYGGAHLFRADSARRLGEIAVQSLDEFAPNFVTFAKAVGLSGPDSLPDSPAEAERLEKYIESDPEPFRKDRWPARPALTIYFRGRDKLRREPTEDLRIDFEDGYGNRSDAEEDGHALQAAGQVADGLKNDTLPPFIGIRIKPLTNDMRERSIRTLDVFLTELARRSAGRAPRHFFVTLPKVTLPEESSALADMLIRLESELNFEPGILRVELMIETPQSILNERGEVNLLALVAAARGRCAAAHFGTYDYTAGRSITAAYQTMVHPACDFAREMMQVSLAGTGVWLSDGATNILPVAPHRRGKEDGPLSAAYLAENRAAVHHSWRLHFAHVRHSLINGYYQGWDLHPAQLPTRYAAVYSFFLESIDAASERLRNFISKAAQATLAGEVFDDAATGQGLLNFFLAAINCGAVSAEEALPLTGLTFAELRAGSFLKILSGRGAQA